MFFKKKRCTEECRKERLELSSELNGRISKVANNQVKLAENYRDFVVEVSRFMKKDYEMFRLDLGLSLQEKTEAIDSLKDEVRRLKDDIKVLRAEAELKNEIDIYKSYNIQTPQLGVLYTKPVIKALNEIGIHTVEELCEKKGFDFTSLKGIGKLTAERINKDIQKYS